MIITTTTFKVDSYISIQSVNNSREVEQTVISSVCEYKSNGNGEGMGGKVLLLSTVPRYTYHRLMLTNDDITFYSPSLLSLQEKRRYI